MRYVPLSERLAAKSARNEETGCLEWRGATVKGGYGVIGNERRRSPRLVLCHRAAYEIAYGEEIPVDEIVMHRCDNPPCIEPTHLLRGDHLRNMRDMVEKGRSSSPRPRSGMLLPEQRKALLAMLTGGMTISAVARVMDIDRKTVRNVKTTGF